MEKQIKNMVLYVLLELLEDTEFSTKDSLFKLEKTIENKLEEMRREIIMGPSK